MDLSTFQELLASVGQAALTEAEAFAPTEDQFLHVFEKLRARFPAPLAKAAIETAVLRRKAKSKFASADRVFLTREALEVASSDATARHRAERLRPYGTIADLCCGIGGDALAFAQAGLTVHAIESDPLRLVMAQANAVALGLSERIRFSAADALVAPLSDARAAYADPSRRTNGRRFLDPEDYTPPLAAIRARFPLDFPLAVKLAPGISSHSMNALDAEIEFVSVDGELKECVAWFGPLRIADRQATVLVRNEGEELVSPMKVHSYSLASLSHAPPPSVGDSSPDRYVFDPDPAVVRAGLAQSLAVELGLRSLDPAVALFTGFTPILSPFLSVFRIDHAARFHLGRLRESLRLLEVGRVTFIKRGSKIDTDELAKKLKFRGDGHRVVILARLGGQETMLIGDRE